MMRLVTGGFAVLIAVLSCTNVALTQVPAAAIGTLFSKFVSAHDPGCAVLVIKDGQPVFRQGYGVTDLRTLQKIGPETNFRLASLTKQFTATAVMLLVHDGKLRYEDRLTDVIPDLPAYAKTITIRQLLNHTSGLADYEDIMAKEYAGIADDKIPQIRDAGVLDLLKRQTSTKFKPGTRWEYSNSGYVVLAMVVEKRSGMSFGDFLRQRIFTPLGMSGTIGYEKGRNEVMHRAYGHTRVADEWSETDQSSTSATLGDGGVYSSLDDLEKWDGALARHTLLTAKEMQPALTPATAANGARLQQSDGSLAPLYGFGWFLNPYRGHRRYTHYGETVGFRTAIQRFPDDRLTVIVLANRAEVDAPALAESVADLYFSELPRLRVSHIPAFGLRDGGSVNRAGPEADRYGTGQGGVLSFVVDDVRTEDVGVALNQEGIAVRAGHHCAQPILRRFGVESTVRPSLAFYNTCEEIDALIAALLHIQAGRGHRSL